MTDTHGITDDGASFLAGVLHELPARVAVGAPTPISYARLVPSHWAGAYACWGRETRESAIRFVTGTKGTEERAANFEVKAFDAAANPYLVAGVTAAAGVAGLARGAKLPPEITGDPATWSEAERDARGVRRLPASLAEATSHLECSAVLLEALGKPLADKLLTVRRAEVAYAAQQSEEAVVYAAGGPTDGRRG